MQSFARCAGFVLLDERLSQDMTGQGCTPEELNLLCGSQFQRLARGGFGCVRFALRQEDFGFLGKEFHQIQGQSALTGKLNALGHGAQARGQVLGCFEHARLDQMQETQMLH